LGIEKTYSVEYTLPANLAARSVTACQIRTDPSKNPESIVQVPKGYQLIIKDIWIDAAPSPDVQAVFWKNRDERVLITDPLSGLIATNPAKPRYKPLIFDEGETLNIDVVNLSAVGASAVSDVFYLKVEEVKKAEARAGVLSTALAKLRF
jgi:hypothetical protein